MFLTTPSMTWPSSRFCDQFLALLGAGLFQDGAARHDDVAAAAIHLQNLERLLDVHQRGDVADRADVDLAARQEGHGAVEIDGEAALDLVEDDARGPSRCPGTPSQACPSSPRAAPCRATAPPRRARSRRAPGRLRRCRRSSVRLPRPGPANSRTGTRPSVFRPTSMTARSFSIPTTVPLMTEPSCRLPCERFVQQRGEIFARRRGSGSDSHEISCCGAPAVGLRAYQKLGPEAPHDLRRPPDDPAGRRETVLSDTICSIRRPTQRARERGFVLQRRGAFNRALGPLGSLDDLDGGPDGGVYIEMRGVEQDARPARA